MRKAPLLGLAAIALATVVPTSAAAAAQRPAVVRLTSTPALFPSFSPRVRNYVVRCDPRTPVRFTAEAATGTTLFVDGRRGRTARVALSPGVAARIEGRNGHGRTTYVVRCLPQDFPAWTVTGAGSPGTWLIATPSLTLGTARSHYIAIFDRNGVPVWWYRAERAPMDAKLLPGPVVAFASFPAASNEYHLRRLDGKPAGRVVSPDGHIDDHELQRRSNGDLVFLVYAPKEHVDLTALGGPADATALEAEIEEISPTGKLVWSWSTDGHVAVAESTRWSSSIVSTPVFITGGLKTYDVFHANAVSVGKNVVLLSLRYTNAVYAIDRTTGRILWKLGGTATPQSLTVAGDPDGSAPLGGQHDVRLQPDGTVTVFDDATYLGRPPRAVRYRIDPAVRTATFLEQVVDPQVATATCCGSARRLADGNWLISWGDDPLVGEYRADGAPLLRIGFDRLFTYRVVPVAASRLTRAELNAGMDAMAPKG